MPRTQFKQRWRKSLKRSYELMWWLDVLYPLLLSLLLVLGTTVFVYSGEAHRSAAGMGEASLIQRSLRIAGYRKVPPAPPRVLVVSLQPEDLADTEERDAPLTLYAAVIRRLLERGVKTLTVDVMNPQRPVSEIAAFVEALASPAERAAITLALAPALKESFTRLVPADLNVVDADPCQDGPQFLCLYQEHWSDWVVHDLVRHAGLDRVRSRLSSNLPGIYPGFLVQLNHPGEDAVASFSSILGSREVLNIDAAFIGNGLVQKRRGGSLTIGRVHSPLTPTDQDPRIAGLTKHRFWAQLSRMIRDDALIDVPPQWLSVLLALLVATTVGVAILRLGWLVGLVGFTILALCAPSVNAALINHARLYVPLFDLLYAGTASFAVVAFSKVSFAALRRWRLEQQEQEDQELADTKGNFLSLASHNLNTPVAKLRGLMGLMLAHAQPEPDRDLLCGSAILAEMQLATRQVLAIIALESKRSRVEALAPSVLAELIEEESVGVLGHLGIEITVAGPKEGDSHLSAPQLDRRTIACATQALVLSYLNQQGGGDATLHYSLIPDPQHGARSAVHLEVTQGQGAEARAPTHRPSPLLRELCGQLLDLLQEYGGADLLVAERGATLTLRSP